MTKTEQYQAAVNTLHQMLHLDLDAMQERVDGIVADLAALRAHRDALAVVTGTEAETTPPLKLTHPEPVVKDLDWVRDRLSPTARSPLSTLPAKLGMCLKSLEPLLAEGVAKCHLLEEVKDGVKSYRRKRRFDIRVSGIRAIRKILYEAVHRSAEPLTVAEVLVLAGNSPEARDGYETYKALGCIQHAINMLASGQSCLPPGVALYGGLFVKSEV